MRTLFLMLVMAAPANAATILIATESNRTTSGSVPVPQAIRFVVRSADASQLLSELVIPGVTPADSGRTWTITAANAADYGYDWATAQAAFQNPLDNRFGVALNNPSSTNVLASKVETCQPDRCVHDFMLQQIDIELVTFFTAPTGTVRNTRATITGTGILVPEPASWLLTAVCLAAVRANGRQRKDQPSHKPRGKGNGRTVFANDGHGK
jgi:hypothetical protein